MHLDQFDVKVKSTKNQTAKEIVLECSLGEYPPLCLNEGHVILPVFLFANGLRLTEFSFYLWPNKTIVVASIVFQFLYDEHPTWKITLCLTHLSNAVNLVPTRLQQSM